MLFKLSQSVLFILEPDDLIGQKCIQNNFLKSFIDDHEFDSFLFYIHSFNNNRQGSTDSKS